MSKVDYTHTKEVPLRNRQPVFIARVPYIAYKCNTCGVETLAEVDVGLKLPPKWWKIIDVDEHMCGRCSDRKEKGI